MIKTITLICDGEEQSFINVRATEDVIGNGKKSLASIFEPMAFGEEDGSHLSSNERNIERESL